MMTVTTYPFTPGVQAFARAARENPAAWVTPTFSVNGVFDRALRVATHTHNHVGLVIIRTLLEELARLPFQCVDTPDDEPLVRTQIDLTLSRLQGGLEPAGAYPSEDLADASMHGGSRDFVQDHAETIFRALGNTMAIFDRSGIAWCVDELVWHLGVDESALCDRFTARCFAELPATIEEARLRSRADALAERLE